MPHRPQRPIRHRVLVVLPLMLGLLVLGAGPAGAQAVSCGTVVTEDFTLENDLLDCPADGLIIGAPRITVDLNGHTISGQRTVPGLDQVGIDNSGGHDDVVIRNGVVQAFEGGGVHLVGVDRSQVLDLELSRFSEFGILLETGSGNRFAGNSVDQPTSVGIGVFGSAVASRDNLIEANTTSGALGSNIALRFGRISGTIIQDNQANEADSSNERWGASIAVSERDSSDADISGTVVRRNRLDFNFGGGILVGAAAEGTLVERNRLDDSFGLPAIENEGDRTLIRRNTVTSGFFPGSTGVGVQVDPVAEDTRVEANNIDRPGFAGVDDLGTRTLVTANLIVGQIFPSDLLTGIWAGIIVRQEASDGRVQANIVRRQSGGGIEIGGDDFVVAANLVSETDLFEDGIRVEPTATGTLLRANITSRHGDDGIDVENPDTTVTANVANDNEDLGIEAVDGVTDGGGNRARGNGNPAQCVGVACS